MGRRSVGEAPGTPLSLSARWSAINGFSTPQREMSSWRSSEDPHVHDYFSTPQRITIMGREHEVVEFRTPQHPLSGSNNWGGASPLLSKNIPKESLGTTYLRFHDFVAANEPELYRAPVASSPAVAGGKRSGRRRPWWLSWRGIGRKEEVVLGKGDEGRKKKKSSTTTSGGRGGGGNKSRWPQGW